MKGEYEKGKLLVELQVKRDELLQERISLESRHDSRLSMLAEFQVVKLQRLRRAARNASSRRAKLAERTRAVLRDIDNCLKSNQDRTKTNAESKLETSIEGYKDHVERLYPTWQEHLDTQNIARLRQLEKRKETLSRRRELARQAFEKETTLRAMVAESEYGVKLLREKEREERLERERIRLKLEEEARENSNAKFAANEAARSPLPEFHPIHSHSESKVSTPLPKIPPKPASIASRESREPYSARSIESEAFELSYEWQTVPFGTTLPSQTEQKLSGGNRLARIPSIWTLGIRLADKRILSVEVSKNIKVGDILKKREITAITLGRSCELVADGEVCPVNATVEELGYHFFQGAIVLDVESDVQTPSIAQNHSKGSTQNWENLQRVLDTLTLFLQNQQASDDIRGSQYGMIGAPPDPHEVDSFLESILLKRVVTLGSEDPDVVCDSIKLLIKKHAIGILPVSLFAENGIVARILRDGDKSGASRSIEEAIDRYHKTFDDARGKFWSTVVRHWRWLVKESLVSRDQLANAFLESLLGPGEEDSSQVRSYLRFMIKELTSNQVSISETRQTHALSYDELLGGDVSPSEEEEEVDDASHLIMSDHKPAAERLRRVMKTLDEEESESDEEVVERRTSSTPGGSLEAFLNANKPLPGSKDIDDAEIVEDDGEFDF